MTDPQHNTAASNNAQSFSVAGCSMMPMAAPISLFDPNMSTPFQVINAYQICKSYSNGLGIILF
jgi:hypothetical protein